MYGFEQKKCTGRKFSKKKKKKIFPKTSNLTKYTNETKLINISLFNYKSNVTLILHHYGIDMFSSV